MALRSPGGIVTGITDVERVEVVKGPQSAFFGKSTFAGAVNITTRAPSYEWGGRINASYERFNTYDLIASVEGPIIKDKLAFRLSGNAFHTDGQYEDASFTDERLGRRNTQSISLTILAEPTEDLSMRFFGVRWTDEDGMPANGAYSDLNCNAGAAPAGTNNFICGKLGEVPRASQSWDQRLFPQALQAVTEGSISLHGADFIEHLGLQRKATQLRGTADWDIGDYTLSAIVAYNENDWAFAQTNFGQDYSGIPNPAFIPDSGRLPDFYTLIAGQVGDVDYYGELRLASPQDERLRWLLGVNYLDATNRLVTSGFLNIGFLQFTPISEFGSEAYAVFGSMAYDFTDQLTLSVEARYQVNNESQDTLGANPVSFEEKEGAFTPRVILEYTPTDNSTVYLSYSEGTRPVEFNGLFFARSEFVQDQIREVANIEGVVPEDRIRMGELGFKGQFFDDRLRILASAYYGIWSDRHIQNTVIVFPTPEAQEVGDTQGISLTGANGKVELKGIELEAAFQVTPNLTLEGTFNIADTKIKRTSSSESFVLTGNSNPVGNQLPFFPRVSGTISATYTQQIAGQNAYVRADGIFTGKQYATEANLVHTPNAFKVNLRVGTTFGDTRVELYGTNIFDNDAPISISRSPTPFVNPDGSVTPRETVRASLANRASYGVRVITEF